MPKVVELLGYPSVSMLSEWKHMYPELVASRKRKTPRSWTQASFDLKMHAIHRCINNGDAIESVAEDIGYSATAVWKWVRATPTLTQEFRHKLVETVKRHKGNIPLTLHLYDPGTKYRIQFYSKKFQVAVTSAFIQDLRRIGIDHYEIVRK